MEHKEDFDWFDEEIEDYEEKRPVRVKIKWSFGKVEVREFESEVERDKFLDDMADDIDSCVLNAGPVPLLTGDEKRNANFYSPERNWSDYEMDMYL